MQVRIWLLGIGWAILGLTGVAFGAGRSGLPALNLDVGSRAESMGGAFVAVADDPSALLWNPAGLGTLERAQASVAYTDWLDTVRYQWLGFVQPLAAWGSLGLGGKLVQGGPVPHTVRTPEGYAERGTFSYGTRHLQVGFGTAPYRNVRVGAALEIVREALSFSEPDVLIPEDSASVNVLHLGVLWEPPINGLRVGATLRNLGGSTDFYGTAAGSPRLLQIGTSYRRRIERVDEKDVPLAPEADGSLPQRSVAHLATVALDLRFLREEKPALRLGVEYRFRNGFALRAGYRSDGPFDLVSKLSAGLGYATESYAVDYGFVPLGELGATHRVVFTLYF